MLERHTRSGLVVAEHGYDERQMQAQLERMDDRLVLSKEKHPSGRLEYVVMKTRGDRPAVEICRWRDDAGNPLPLSSGLLGKVDRLRADSRAAYDDPVAHNEAMTERNRRAMDNAAREAADDVERRHGRIAAFHRGRGLQLARARARESGEQA